MQTSSNHQQNAAPTESQLYYLLPLGIHQQAHRGQGWETGGMSALHLTTQRETLFRV